MFLLQNQYVGMGPLTKESIYELVLWYELFERTCSRVLNRTSHHFCVNTPLNAIKRTLSLVLNNVGNQKLFSKSLFISAWTEGHDQINFFNHSLSIYICLYSQLLKKIMERFIGFFSWFSLHEGKFYTGAVHCIFINIYNYHNVETTRLFLCKIKQCKATVSYIQPHDMRCTRETSYKRVEINDHEAIINRIRKYSHFSSWQNIEAL